VARDDWFRNTTWNDEIEAVFHRRLRRARDKSKYLRIQAWHLAESHPGVALRLLEQYFQLGESFDRVWAYCDQARALAALGDVEGAVYAYEAALQREREVPSVKARAFIDFPRLVVEAGLEGLYERALEVLNSPRDQIQFPVDRYYTNGLRAVILHHLGRTEEARAVAGLAMAAARETHSGLRYHPDLGLVGTADDALGRRIAAIASQSV
jgi:hypothetical protein